MNLPLKDRAEAGKLLAEDLSRTRISDNAIVLALPRGGVPVAFEVAHKLGAELDLLLVRKLGVPGQPELAMGAIASGGVRVLNEDIVNTLNIGSDAIAEVASREQKELERRENTYRGDREYPELDDRDIVLVDDGLATGATMRAAVRAIRQKNPAYIYVAVPVAPRETVAALRRDVNGVVCLASPEPFVAIGNWYVDFDQVSDEEVAEFLGKAWNQTTV